MKTNNCNLLLIFTRNPELGKCKTRLAAKIGKEAALDIYKFLLQHTVILTRNLDCDKWVFYSEEIWEDDIWDTNLYSKKLQVGKDLGDRMLNAFQGGFDAGYKNIIVIGSDMFDLSQSDLETAFQKLEEQDFVVGPAEDGGYYLLGMRKLKVSLFSNKEWGKDTVLKATLANLEDEQLALLKEKNDVDHYEDIKDIKAFSPFLKHM